MNGTIFSIEELAVYDGPGARVNVFFKGCPLRCKWCHNPEGWSKKPQIVKNINGCIDCGLCKKVCTNPDECVLCKQCVYICPKDLIRVCGKEYSPDELVRYLLSFESQLNECGGGITFSGGEPLLQCDFLCQVLDKMAGRFHTTIETSGFSTTKNFNEVISRIDFVFFDLKLMDDEKHKLYTGQSNQLILNNAKILRDSEKAFVFRIPMISGINSDVENASKVCEFVAGANHLQYVEILPYNTFAGAKYSMLGMEYQYNEFIPPASEELFQIKRTFEKYHIPLKIKGKLII